MQYEKTFKEEAVKLSDEIGVKATAAQLSFILVDKRSGFTQTTPLILNKMMAFKTISLIFFDFLLTELYGINDWKQLSYKQMYELIHILTYYNYTGDNLQ